MSTIYIRDVPDDVAATLKARAASDGKSLSAYLAAELTRLAARPSNAELIERMRARLGDGGVTRDAVLTAIQAARR